MIITTRLATGTYRDLEEWSHAAGRLDEAGVTSLVLAATAESTQPSRFEATTLASYVAQETSSLGIVADETTLYGQPYHVARRLATLDHLTGGRAGWHLRTSTTPGEAAGYEWASPSAEAAGSRTPEYVDIVLALWDSWEAGAERPDKRAGDFHDDSRIHAIDHASESFLVRGPLDTPRTPQGRPVIFADVASADDAALVGRFADIAVVRAETRDAVLALTAATSAAVTKAGRQGEVRMLVAVSDLVRPLTLALSAEAVEAVASARDIVTAAGADGIEVTGDGSPEGLGWLCDSLAPALTGEGILTGTLMARLGLDAVARFGRRAA